MTNLIKNAQWNPGPSGGPMYFSGTAPITFDEFSMNGYRSCSITMADNKYAKDAYDLPIDVTNADMIHFGMMVRAVDITHMSYVMEFYNENRYLIDTQMKDETENVTHLFTEVFATFKVPMKAKYAKVFWQFKDTVTACTFLAPQAYID